MELRLAARYPLHSKALIAFSDKTVLACRIVDVSTSGVCILLDRQINMNIPCYLRFSLKIAGQHHELTAPAKATYGTFATEGVRVGLQFADDNPQRTALIHALAKERCG